MNTAVREARARPPLPSNPEAALFNEAYVAILIALAARHYREKTSGRGLPWTLAFLVIPLVVHRSTRERLPGTTVARFSNWISSQPLLHASFADQAVALAPYVRRGLRYGLRSGVISLDGDVINSRVALQKYTSLSSADGQDAGRHAAFLGRWFAVIEDVPAVFRQLGVMP
jgi:hypothetical protein